jgi:tripartite-type tricarboxylate transporter receptor subunit TctC
MSATGWAMKRRTFLAGVAAAAVGPAARTRGEEAWPQRAVTLVVPFGAGGSADLVARIFAQGLQAKYGISVVIENKGGAGGTIGTGMVAKAAPDGYTLVLGTLSTHAINPSIYAKLPYDAERDFAPISPLVRFPNLLVINPKLPVRTVADFVAYLKANDGKLNFGSAGNGTSSHLCAVMLMRAVGVSMAHIPFRGSSDEMNALIGGHIDFAFDSMTTLWPLAQSGEVRPLAVSSPQRSAVAPDVPAIGETIAGFDATGWQGVFAPAGTPRDIVVRLAQNVKEIFTQPDILASLRNVGGDPLPMMPDEFARFVVVERVKWAKVAKASGVRIE